MDIHETLVAARKVQEHGHVKSLLELDGKYCMRGSILFVVDGKIHGVHDDYSYQQIRAAEYAICKANGWNDYYNKIPQMNNRPETTLADVLGWFDRAIEMTAPQAVPMGDPAHTFSIF